MNSIWFGRPRLGRPFCLWDGCKILRLEPSIRDCVAFNCEFSLRMTAEQAPNRFLSHQFADLVAEHGLRYVQCLWLSAGQRLGEVIRLLGLDLGGHRRLKRIDDGF